MKSQLQQHQGDAMYASKAQTLWAEMDQNEKAVVRFGMFPHDKMLEAEKDGFNGQQLAVALMNCAKADGGMRV